MQLYSTNNASVRVDFKTALMEGLPADKGLFMPLEIPRLPESFVDGLERFTFNEIAYLISSTLLKDAIPDAALQDIITQAINFPAPVHLLDENVGVLELFHGPSMAFKDFGARFMAQTMSWFNRHESKDLTILVATSGDTGGAVAAGFLNTPGINVVILYPSGKVSHIQELQLTTLGNNITALEVDGTFDDCQALVKQAFLDSDISTARRLSSANSINIARLIPQSFYYFEAYKQVKHLKKPIVFSVPSGNFGNLTAGLIAKKMGLPVHKYIAATNANDIVPEYLRTGIYTPRPSIRTLSNAMDVGSPSNFARMEALYGSTWNTMKQDIVGFAFDDTETIQGIKQVYNQYNYIIDPHGAVGYLALKSYQKGAPETFGIVLETAHPAKFLSDMEAILGETIPLPDGLKHLLGRQKHSIAMPKDYPTFKSWLLSETKK